MKRYSYFLALILSVSLFGARAQQIFLVDNNPGAPTGTHVHGDVASAMAAASSGDIIHIKSSPNSYGNFIITKAGLSFVGIGFNPNKDLPLTAIVGNIDLDASNTRLSGLVIDQVEIANASGVINVTGVSIDGCEIDQLRAPGSDDFVDNIIIRNCLLGNTIGSNNSNRPIDFNNNVSNAIITNNIIVGATGGLNPGAITISGALIKNNLFLGNGAIERRAFATISNNTINNNVFYGRSPQAGGSSTTNVFNSNATIGLVSGQEVFPPIGGTGDTEDGNNIDLAVSPSIFTDANIVISDAWILTWDPTLDPTNGASLINSGTDGTDRGVTGSTLGYSVTGTPVPFIKIFNTSELIKQGTDLQVTIEAQGN